MLSYLTHATADHALPQVDLYQCREPFGFLILAPALLRAGWALSGVKPQPVAGMPR